MSLLRTAQASPSRRRQSVKLSQLRAKFESNSVGESTSFRSSSMLDASVTTSKTDSELKRLVHDVTKETIGSGSASIISAADSSTSSFTKNLSGSSGTSAFSISRAYNDAKRKIHQQRELESSSNSSRTPPLEIKASSSSGKSGRVLSLGKNLRMNFDFTVPIDRVHVQHGQHPLPADASEVAAEKLKNEAYEKAQKMLEKVDEQQRIKIAQAKQKKLEDAKRSLQVVTHEKPPTRPKLKIPPFPNEKSVIIPKMSPSSSSSGTSGARLLTTKASNEKTKDTSIKQATFKSTNSGKVGAAQNQKQKLLARLEKMGVKPVEAIPSQLSNHASLNTSSMPYSFGSERSRESHSGTSKDPYGKNWSSHGSVDPPSGILLVNHGDDSTLGSGTSSRSNEENFDPTSPRSVQTPKSTNCSKESSSQSHSNVRSKVLSMKQKMSLSRSIQGDVIVTSDIRDQKFGNSHNDHNMFGDNDAAEIALQMLSAKRYPATSKVYSSSSYSDAGQESMKSVAKSVRVLTEGRDEDFEAIHVEDTYSFAGESLKNSSLSSEYSENGNEQNVGHQFSSRESVDQWHEQDRLEKTENNVYEGNACHERLNLDDDENSLEEGKVDKYAIDAIQSHEALERHEESQAIHWSTPAPEVISPSSFMEDIFNLAASRLSAGSSPSKFSFDNIFDFGSNKKKESLSGKESVITSNSATISLNTDHESQSRSKINQESVDDNLDSNTDGEDDFIELQVNDNTDYENEQYRTVQMVERGENQRYQSNDSGNHIDFSGFFGSSTSSPIPLYHQQESSSINEGFPHSSLLAASSMRPKPLLTKSKGAEVSQPPSEAFNHSLPIQQSPIRALADDLSNSREPSSISEINSMQTKGDMSGYDSVDATAGFSVQNQSSHSLQRDNLDSDFPSQEQNLSTIVKSESSQSLINSFDDYANPQTLNVGEQSLNDEKICPFFDHGSSFLRSEKKSDEEVKSPSTVDKFPSSCQVKESFNVESQVETNDRGEQNEEPLLSESNDYWDTLSSIATSSLLRSEKNFEDLTEFSAPNLRPLSPVLESSMEMEGGCICPWNEHIMLPKDHPDYKGPPQHSNYDELGIPDSEETYDEGIPVLISYLPGENRIDNLPKEPLPMMPNSTALTESGSLGNLRSILTESSASSASTSSPMLSKGKSDENELYQEDYLPENYNSVFESPIINEAIKRGEGQALMDSPKPRVNEMKSQNCSLMEQVKANELLSLPLLPENEFDSKNITEPLTLFSASDPKDGIETDISHMHRWSFPQENENFGDSELNERTTRLDMISHLIGESNSKETTDIGNLDDNSENTDDLLLALSRSMDRGEGDTSEVAYPLQDMEPSPGAIDDFMQTQRIICSDSPQASLAAVGGSPKRRRMKLGECKEIDEHGTDENETKEIDYSISTQNVGNTAVKNNQTNLSKEEPHNSKENSITVDVGFSSFLTHPLAERSISPTKLLRPSPELTMIERTVSPPKQNIDSSGIDTVNCLSPRMRLQLSLVETKIEDMAMFHHSPREVREHAQCQSQRKDNEGNPRDNDAFHNQRESMNFMCEGNIVEGAHQQKRNSYENHHSLSNRSERNEVQPNNTSQILSLQRTTESGLRHNSLATKIEMNEHLKVYQRKSNSSITQEQFLSSSIDPHHAEEEIKKAKMSPDQHSNDPVGNISRHPSPEKVRYSSPERATRGPSPEKAILRSPKKSEKSYSTQNATQAIVGSSLQKYVTETKASSSPQRKRPSPELRRPPQEEARRGYSIKKENKETSNALENVDSASPPKFKCQLTVDTEDLEPAYSFETDRYGKKTLGRSPRLQSVLSRIEQRRKEKETKGNPGKKEFKIEETLEEYDTLVDQLMRQNKTLKRGGRASETSLGSDSEVIKEKIIDLRVKKVKALDSIPSFSKATRAAPPSPDNRNRYGISKSIASDDISVRSDAPSIMKKRGSTFLRAEDLQANSQAPVSINRPPRPEDASPKRLLVRSQSLPSGRIATTRKNPKSAEENEGGNKRVMSYTEQVREVFNSLKHRMDTKCTKLEKMKAEDTKAKDDLYPISKEICSKVNLPDVHKERMNTPKSDDIQKSHQTKEKKSGWTRAFNEGHQEQESRLKNMDYEKMQDKYSRDGKESAIAESNTPYMDRLLRDRGMALEFDKRNPSPADRNNHSLASHSHEMRELFNHESEIPKKTETKDPFRYTQPIHSYALSTSEKRRLLGEFISEQTNQLKRDLDQAKLSSHLIRDSQANLSTELQAFEKKLSQHSRNKRGEREIIGACQSELGGFQQRLRDLGTRSDSFVSEITVDSVWEDFSEIRGAMLTNLKLMHDAQERLLRKRFQVEDDYSEEASKLREIQDLMATIRDQEKYDSDVIRLTMEAAQKLGS